MPAQMVAAAATWTSDPQRITFKEAPSQGLSLFDPAGEGLAMALFSWITLYRVNKEIPVGLH